MEPEETGRGQTVDHLVRGPARGIAGDGVFAQERL
jgi:hypothetical protein